MKNNNKDIFDTCSVVIYIICLFISLIILFIFGHYINIFNYSLYLTYCENYENNDILKKFGCGIIYSGLIIIPNSIMLFICFYIVAIGTTIFVEHVEKDVKKSIF